MEISKTLKTLPKRPGVYIFKDKDAQVLYVGKAIDLARRVKSYFQNISDREWKTQELRTLIHSIQTIETVSEFDALLLEAKLIRFYQPKFNIITKDDKSSLYIVLTIHDPLPHIVFARKTQLVMTKRTKTDRIFGPFQSAKMARTIMKQIRIAIPYCLQKQRNGTACFYTHLGLCNPCPSQIIKIENPDLQKEQIQMYRRNIFRISNILSGKTTNVLRKLEKEMNHFADSQQFEQAQLVRNQIQSLYSILERHYDPSAYLSQSGTYDIYNKELETLKKMLVPFFPNLVHLDRIECIDISNISGQFATGSLVVLSQGRIDKASYKRFRIKRVTGSNDTAMIAEVVSRRFNHPEWSYPNLLVIDGGKGQITSASLTLKNLAIEIPVIGLAKRREEIIIQKSHGFSTLRFNLTSPGLHVLIRIRDEAHRFALSYHRKLRGSSLTHRGSI